MRSPLCLVLGLSLVIAGGIANAAPARVIKVLPHYLDKDGRNSLSPSLYERDAYQAQLRLHPELCSALRFDVQWKARKTTGPLKLRLELKGSKEAAKPPRVLETSVKPGRVFSRWSALTLDRAELESFGEVIAWRATLWEGESQVAELKSFLW